MNSKTIGPKDRFNPEVNQPHKAEEDRTPDKLSERLDEAIEETFPASDAPSSSPMTGVGKHARTDQKSTPDIRRKDQ